MKIISIVSFIILINFCNTQLCTYDSFGYLYNFTTLNSNGPFYYNNIQLQLCSSLNNNIGQPSCGIGYTYMREIIWKISPCNIYSPLGPVLANNINISECYILAASKNLLYFGLNWTIIQNINQTQCRGASNFIPYLRCDNCSGCPGMNNCGCSIMSEFKIDNKIQNCYNSMVCQANNNCYNDTIKVYNSLAQTSTQNIKSIYPIWNGLNSTFNGNSFYMNLFCNPSIKSTSPAIYTLQSSYNLNIKINNILLYHQDFCPTNIQYPQAVCIFNQSGYYYDLTNLNYNGPFTGIISNGIYSVATIFYYQLCSIIPLNAPKNSYGPYGTSTYGSCNNTIDYGSIACYGRLNITNINYYTIYESIGLSHVQEINFLNQYQPNMGLQITYIPNYNGISIIYKLYCQPNIIGIQPIGNITQKRLDDDPYSYTFSLYHASFCPK